MINKDLLYHVRFKTKRARKWRWYGKVYTLKGAVERVGYDNVNGDAKYAEIYANGGFVPGVLGTIKETGHKWHIGLVIPVDYDMEEDSDTWEIEFDVNTERQKLHDACDTVLRTLLENEMEE